MITSFFKTKSQKLKPASSDGPSNPGSAEKRERADDHESAPNTKRSKSAKDPVVEDILSALDKHESDGKTWYDVIEKHASSPSFSSLAKFVSTERKAKTIFPPPQDVFSPLNLTPLDQVRVVIVGQDPYHGPGQAHGLCFSVRKGIQVPPSLRNIYKELVEDKSITNFTSKPTHGFLERWAKQGVLMINAVLTVQKGNANSHKKKGWELVTDEIIRAVDRRSKANGKGVVFLLWGKPATTKATTVLGGTASSRHTIICTSHPSPLGATKTEVRRIEYFPVVCATNTRNLSFSLYVCLAPTSL
jgi:uracil-DNA glycosylase